MSVVEQFDRVTIPEKYYAGYQWRNECVLGFITPYGTDAAAEKRMRTVNDWRDKKDGELTPELIDNVPQAGFRLIRNVTRYQTSNVVWRVMDPRGFELEITSANLAMLLQTSTIVNGIIQTECIWGRGGGSNVLVSVDSEVYKWATENTTLKNSKVSLKDIKIGDLVTLQNNTSGQYMGKLRVVTTKMNHLRREYGYHSYSMWNRQENTSPHVISITPGIDKQVFVLRVDNDKEEIVQRGRDPYEYNTSSSLKVGRVAPSNLDMSEADAIRTINEEMDSGFRVNMFDSANSTLFIGKKDEWTFGLHSLDPATAETIITSKLENLSGPRSYRPSIPGMYYWAIKGEPLFLEGDAGKLSLIVARTDDTFITVDISPTRVDDETFHISFPHPKGKDVHSSEYKDFDKWMDRLREAYPSVHEIPLDLIPYSKYRTIGVSVSAA